MATTNNSLQHPPSVRIVRTYGALVQFPVVCFVLALATDITYWRTSDIMWMIFSAWLLLAGIVAGGLAAVAYAIGLLQRQGEDFHWGHAAGGALVLLLAFVNNLVHARDGWTSVVPLGLSLSVATVLAIIATAWLGASPARRNLDFGGRRHA